MSIGTLEEHRRLWAAKPALREVYGVWFDALLASLSGATHVLEIGSGPGFLSVHARATGGRRWLAADVPQRQLAVPESTNSVSEVGTNSQS